MDVELNNLTEAERDAITSVLRRDEELRKKEMDRIRKLRNEVKRIRMKGVIKAGHDPMKTCARCRAPFGWLFNKGAVCSKCQHKVCDKCRSTLSKVSNKWLCTLCYKQKELDGQTNRWFYAQFRKSKRSRKTNNVITGPEIVRASMRRAHRDAASGSGSDGGRSSIGDEIKRVLSNNNASPKSRRSASQSTAGGGPEELGESSDTQSMGASSPRHRKHNHHPRDVSDVTFPKDSDRQRLFDLIRPKSVEETQASPNLQVKRVVNKKYSDSDSSTSGSEASSPNISMRHSSFGYSDSMRSSLRSSSAVSSEGRMTIVTESNISDIDTISIMSEMPQETPVMVPRAHQEKVQTSNHMSPSRSGSNTFKSSDSVIDHPSHSSQIVHSNSTLDEYEPAETVVVHKMINRRRDSMSSDSEDDFTTEQITKVKFRRVSKKGQRSRSPSPESRPGKSSSKTSTPKPSREEVVGSRGGEEGLTARGAAAATGGRDTGERAGNARGRRVLVIGGATAEKTNNNSSAGARVNTSGVLRRSSTGATDKVSPATAAVGAAAASSKLALSGGGADAEYFSSDNSDEEMAAIGWQDDDPIRSKVGSLLKKYGRMEGVNATSYSKEANKAGLPERKYEPHSNLKSRSSVGDLRVTFNDKVIDDDEYVIIDGVHDTSTETSVEPQSGSEGARSVSDINDDSFEDLEWDSDIVPRAELGVEAEDEVDNAMLMHELRAAVAASLASADDDSGRRSPTSSRGLPPGDNHSHTTASSSSVHATSSKSQGYEDVYLEGNDDDKPINYEFHSYASDNDFSRIGRYPRMFPLQDDEISDSLSIITELTEPDNESGRFSSRSSTPTSDSRRSYSRSSTPIQKQRSSTPSTIEELDTEDEILARPPSHENSSKSVRVTKSGGTVSGVEADSSENNSPQPDSVESDHSFSQTSECSATESAQESHPASTSGPLRHLLPGRKDSFDMLAESSLQASAALDFADVYEANAKFVDPSECDFNETEIRINTASITRAAPAKPTRNTAQSKENKSHKSTVEVKKVTSRDLAKEASDVVKRKSESKSDDSPDGVESKVGRVEMRKKKSDGKDISRNSTGGIDDNRLDVEAGELAESYKEMRKSLTHVERTGDPGETKGKRRKMSDGLVVDNTPVASLSKLTQMFDVVPAYMRAGSPRPSDTDRGVSTSSNSSAEHSMDSREGGVKNSEYSMVSVDEQPVLFRKGRKNRETYVIDTDDFGPMNLSDLGSEGICDTNHNKVMDTENTSAFSCPSHSSFNEGLKADGDSPNLTSSLKPNKSPGSKSKSSKKVTIMLNNQEIGESSTDDNLDDSTTDHISQGDNKVLEVSIPGGHSEDEDHSDRHYATQNEESHYHSLAQEDAHTSSVYYSASNETPLQITRVNMRREHRNDSRSSRVSDVPREASFLDENSEEDSEVEEEDYAEHSDGGEVSGAEVNSGSYYGGYGGDRPMGMEYNSNTSQDAYYETNRYGGGTSDQFYSTYSYAQGHPNQGLDTISEVDSELIHDHEVSATHSRTSWASSDYSVDNSADYYHHTNKVQRTEVSRSDKDEGSWSSRSRSSRSGSDESVHSSSSHRSDNGSWNQSRSDNRKSCVSFDSLDVYLDCESDTAEERAHPERLEEDFALSLDLGPRLDPNLSYSNTPLKRGLRERKRQQEHELSDSEEGNVPSRNTRSDSNARGRETRAKVGNTSLRGNGKSKSSENLVVLHASGSSSSLSHDVSSTNPNQSNVHPDHTSSLSDTSDSTPKLTPTEVRDTTTSTDKQSDGPVKVVHKQQKKIHTEEDLKLEGQQQQPNENDQLINGDKTVKEYGDLSQTDGGESRVAPASDGDYRTSDSPRHTEDANTKPEVPSILAVQQDESSGDKHYNGEDAAATPSGGDDNDDVIKAESPLVTSSPKHESYGAGPEEDDDLDAEEIHVDEDELENIDDIVASVKSTPTRSTRSTAPINRSTGNLLSAFSASKESIASYYSDAGEGHYGNVAVTGEILFGLDYNYKTGSLEIAVKQCRDLAAVDKKRNRSDPYAKTYLLPDKTKSGKRKTRAKKHTLNPSFDELLKYQITKSELETRTLWISVWNNDTFGRNDFLGEVSMPLDYYAFDDSSPQWYKLQDRGLHSKIKKFGKDLPRPLLSPRQGSPPPPHTSAMKHPENSPGGLSKQKSKSVSFLDTPHLPKLSGSQSQEMLSSADPFSVENMSPKGKNKAAVNSSSMALITYKGDLVVLLKFVTADNASSKKSKGGGKSRGELHVLIKEARNLTAVRSNGTSDPFCKGYLLPEKTRGTKQKTPVIKRNVNPQWNHTLVFEDISLDDLRERAVELTIWDHDRFTSNDFLGGVRLNMGTGRCAGKEVDWMDARGEEITLWEHMLDHPNAWKEASLMLRHSMEKRI